MYKSRAVPSGKVYRQQFDAQAQLSRSLLAGRRDTGTECVSAEDSNTVSSTTSRWCPHSSMEQHSDEEDVCRLPDTVVADQPRSDIVERVAEKRNKKHNECLEELQTELMEVAQVCETRVRSVSEPLHSALQEVDLRLNSLEDRMKHVDLQDVQGLWEDVEKQVKIKKSTIMELKHKLTECESERTEKVRAVLRKYSHQLETVCFLPPSEVSTLILSDAMTLNQSLLANRRSVARLVLLLQEDNLQQESLLRLQWEDCLIRWRRIRVGEVVDGFRRFCCSDEEQQSVTVQTMSQEMKKTQSVLTDQRRDIIGNICSLVPPSCSTALVSDWFSQLTAINQQIDNLHTGFLHQLRCCYEQRWQDRLSEVERCKETLSALQLSKEEMNDVVRSQLLTLVGRIQSQDEERLATFDVCCDSVAHHSLGLSSCVFAVMRGLALLWERHSCRLKRREEELERQLDDLRDSQQRLMQTKKVRLDVLLAELHQGSSEEALQSYLHQAVCNLQEINQNCSVCVSDQYQLLDRLPSLWLDEFVSYSRSLSSFLHLSHAYTPSSEDVQKLLQASANPSHSETSEDAEIQKPEEGRERCPIRCQSDTHSAPFSQDWLTEAESSLLDLYDVSTDVVFTTTKGVAYSAPVFRCAELEDNLQQETHLSLFPVELLTHTLIRTRTLFMDHREQHVHSLLSSAVSTVTDRKEGVHLQLQLELNPEYIRTHIYQPRLAELQEHRQRVDAHCEEVLDMLTSCRVELQELQAYISGRNQEFSVTVDNMKRDMLSADIGQRVQAVSATLQDCLDQHIQHTQSRETAFRLTVQTRMQEARNRTAQLLSSFRLFSEGGNFALQEVTLFKRRLKMENKEMSAIEASIFNELEAFESKSLQQVKHVLAHLENKLSLVKSEVTFREKIQKVLRSTQIQIKAEAASSNQQQSAISSRLEDLRRMLENTQVSPDQVCSFLSSINEELIKRCQYLDQQQLLERLPARPQSRKQVFSPLPPDLLQPSKTDVDLLNDPVVNIIKSLNSFSLAEGKAAADERRTSAGPIQRPESVRPRRNRSDLFGPEPVYTSHSFRSTVKCFLWRTNNDLLQAGTDFYHRPAVNSSLLLPHTFDEWADSMQQRLLGYQEQTKTFLSKSAEELEHQLSLLNKLLLLLPSVLISNHENHKGAELKEEVCKIRLKLEKTHAASEKEKGENVRRLRVAGTDDELQTLNSREELRQQQLEHGICSTHLQLQECVRVRAEEFVTSLASLTWSLLHQLDIMRTLGEADTMALNQHCEASTVTTETKAGSRTWSGISYSSPPTDHPSSATMTKTTVTITSSRCTLGHLAVMEQRDAAVKRFEQLFRSEMSQLDDDKRRRLKELQRWRAQWTHSLL